MVLEDVERELRQYCHAPTCELWWECPGDHESCLEYTGLKEALAWTAADILASKKRSKESVGMLGALVLVLQKRKKTHPYLYDLLREAHRVARKQGP